jgi:hypothetical protein
MPDGLLGRIAQGPDITTPLLQGIGLARQRQQDVVARQQQEVLNQARQQQLALQQQQVQAQQAQQKFQNDFTRIKTLNDLGLTDEAINLSEQTFGEEAGINFDAFRERKAEFKTVLGALSKTFTDPKLSNEQRTQTFNQQVAELTQAFPRLDAQAQVTPQVVPQPQIAQAQVAPQPVITGQAGVPDLAQQVSPQDRIRAARQQLLNIQQQFPQLSQTAQGKAAIKTLEDSIKFEESQLTSVRGTVTNVDKMFDINVANWKAQNPGAILTPAITKTLREQAHQTVGGTTNIIGTDPKTGNLLFMDTKTGDVIDAGRPRPAPGKLQPLSSQAAENVGVQNSVIQGIDRALENVRKKPELLEKIGPLEGRWTNIKRVFAADPEAEGLKREIESMIRVAYAWSGKQISIQELDRLRDAILPSLTNPDANFMVSLRHAKNIMETDRNAKLQAFKDANFDIGKLDRFLKKDKSAKTADGTGQTTSGNRFTIKEIP